jgi:hypothetical protein
MKKKPPRRRVDAAPHYELRIEKRSTSDLHIEVFQLPAPATPSLKEPRRIAGLHGRNLALVEARLLKQLARNRVDVTRLKVGERQRSEIDEDLALRLGLLFRVLAPMRSRRNMVACATGVESMGKEEAAYWLGMAMHRKYPRRVLMALRFLLIDPREG